MNTSTDSAPWRVGQLLTGLIAATLLISALLLHARLISYLEYDGENSGSETEPLYALQRVRAGESLYHDYTVPPHSLTVYTPLFYLLPGQLARALDTDWWATVRIGRYCTYGMWLGIALIIYGLVRQARCDWLPSAVAGLLWLSGQLATGWAISFKPDASSLFFSLAALWVYQRGQRPIHAVSVCALLVLAALHKHTAVAPLAAILIDELLQRRFRQVVMLLAGWLGTMIMVTAAGQALTGGWFVRNVFTCLLERAPWQWPLLLMMESALLGMVAFSGSVLALVTTRNRPELRLLKLYFFWALMAAIGGTTVFGTLGNHYLEPFAIACVLTAALLQRWRSTPCGIWAVIGRLGWLGLAFGLCWSVLTARFHEWQATDEPAARRADARHWGELLQRLADTEGPILSEDQYLAVRMVGAPYMTDVSKFAHMQRNGLFTDDELLRKITSGEFTMIVAKHPLDEPVRHRPFPERWIEPMRRHYRLVDRYDWQGRHLTYYIYQPKTGDE